MVLSRQHLQHYYLRGSDVSWQSNVRVCVYLRVYIYMRACVCVCVCERTASDEFRLEVR